MTQRTSNRVVFLHLPKTGGMTLRDVIGRQYHRGERLEFTRRYAEQYRAFIARPQHERDAFRLIYGHLPFGIHQYVTGSTVYTAMLRHPVDRIISQYYNMAVDKAIKQDRDQMKSLEEYVTHPMRGNLTVTWLIGFRPGSDDPAAEYDKHHLPPEDAVEQAKANLRDHFAVVGLTERFDVSLLLMRRAFGWGSMAYVRRNVGQRRRSLESVTPEMRAFIEAHCQPDLAIYHYAQELFEAKVATYGPSLDADVETLRQQNSRYARWWNLTAPLHRNRYVQKLVRKLGLS